MDSTLGLPKSSMSSISGMIDSQSDNESIDTPLVSPFLDSDDELDDGEVLNELDEHTIDQSVGGKLREKNIEKSWTLIEDLALYDNESWNDPRDLAKPVKAISLTQDVPKTSDLRLIELENQVQHLMEAHLAPKPSV
ncbi:hypothetical protein Tco_0535891 [Tanacetum coccineum]